MSARFLWLIVGLQAGACISLLIEGKFPIALMLLAGALANFASILMSMK